jgi:hypothetical protein
MVADAEGGVGGALGMKNDGMDATDDYTAMINLDIQVLESGYVLLKQYTAPWWALCSVSSSAPR